MHDLKITPLGSVPGVALIATALDNLKHGDYLRNAPIVAPQLPWRFGVLDTDSVNAFAVPCGYVFITRGLLARMRDEAELAGVLAHEIGHVVEKPMLNTLRKGSLVGFAGDALGEYAAKKGARNTRSS